MKRPAIIRSIKSKTAYPRQLPESMSQSLRLRQHRIVGSQVNKESFSRAFVNIDWCTAPVPVDGKLEILFSEQRSEVIQKVSLPVQSSFFVTCTKEGDDYYKVCWSCSLS